MKSRTFLGGSRAHHHFTVELEDGVDNNAVHEAIMKCLIGNYDVGAVLVDPTTGNDSSTALEMVDDPELTYSVRGKLQEVLNARKGVRRLSRGKIKFNVWWPL